MMAEQTQQEIHDQIGKLKTDLFKCIGTIEHIQSKCRDVHTSAKAPEPDEYIISFDHLMAIKETAYPLTIEERKRICDASRPVLETPITELSAINTALLKLYPDDFALQLNAKQLIQIRKEHDAQVAKVAREQVLDDLVYWMYDCPFGGREGSDRCHTILAHKIESLRSQQEPHP